MYKVRLVNLKTLDFKNFNSFFLSVSQSYFVIGLVNLQVIMLVNSSFFDPTFNFNANVIL